MKRFFAVILMLGLLCGCTKPEPVQPTEPTQSTQPTQITQPTQPKPDPSAAHLAQQLPVMDGSTSLIPLEAAIRAAVYGKTLEEATADVVHSSTWQSFYNLLDGSADLIFSCPLSGMQYDDAAYMGVELELVPVAMEGFVFVVNAENPVDSLSQQQIRDIYSGKITNWSQVGGLDAPIVAYQRNTDSGSQNYMLEFMGDTPLTDAPMDMRPASMSGLMDVIAVNDHALNAIGYSVYAYAANMYGNGNEIKFIKVDGVAPSRKTFADYSYPLLGKNYAVFRADEQEGSPARLLVDWLTGYDGQLAVAKAGYVTLTDVGYDYEEMTLQPYRGTGMGAPAQQARPDQYIALQTGEYGVISDQLPLRIDTTLTGRKTYRLEVQAAPELLAQIHAFIDEQMLWAQAEGEKTRELLKKLNAGEEYPLYSYGPGWDAGSGVMGEQMDAACTVTAANGYLSVAISVGYSYDVMESYSCFTRVETATWDLLTGQRLAPEELFCRDVDINAVLSAYLRKVSQQPRSSWGSYYEMKRDFAALPQQGWHLTHDAIYFDADNPYFLHGARIALDQLPDGIMVSQTPREFFGYLSGEGVLVKRGFRLLTRDIVYERFDEDTALALLDLPQAQQMNQTVREYVTTHFTYQAVTDYFVQKGQFQTGEGSLWFTPFDWYMTDFGDRYILYSGTEQFVYHPDTGECMGRYPYETFLLFDLTTGQRIGWQDMLKPGWEDHAEVLSGWEKTEQVPWDRLIPVRMYDDMTEDLSIGFFLEPEDSEPGTADVRYIHVRIPEEYVNYGY